MYGRISSSSLAREGSRLCRESCITVVPLANQFSLRRVPEQNGAAPRSAANAHCYHVMWETLNAPESAGSAPKSRHQPSSRCRHLRFMEAAPQTSARHARRASAFNFWSPKADSSTFARKLLVGLADFNKASCALAFCTFYPLKKSLGFCVTSACWS